MKGKVIQIAISQHLLRHLHFIGVSVDLDLNGRKRRELEYINFGFCGTLNEGL